MIWEWLKKENRALHQRKDVEQHAAVWMWCIIVIWCICFSILIVGFL